MKSDESETTVRDNEGVNALTADNAFFWRLTTDNKDATNSDVVIAEEIVDLECAVTCKLGPTDTVRAYVEAGIAPATRRPYKTDLERFRAWGGSIPTTDLQLAAYLAEQATTLKVATLTRRLAAISIAHKAQRLPRAPDAHVNPYPAAVK
jgi:hypothetical protein